MEHARHSIRLRGYDYSSFGYYFVTVCAYERKCLFGEFVDGKMVLSEFGSVVLRNWQSIASRFGVKLDEFIVMPNHIHGIVCFGGRGLIYQTQKKIEQIHSCRHMGVMNHAPTLGGIIRYVKAKSSKIIHEINPNILVWQRNYYERIIRNEKELIAVREYIQNNPKNWETDEENVENVDDM